MKRRLWLLLVFGIACTFASSLLAGGRPLSPELQKLNISLGRWVFHGKSLRTPPGKTGAWTWNEDCRWSSNQRYLLCTFSNIESGKPVETLVVDTYNSTDHSYWHYELYSEGRGGNNPFVTRMEIRGNTWLEYGVPRAPGKKPGERIVYRWQSPSRVTVTIENSKDGVHWTPVSRGEGVKEQ